MASELDFVIPVYNEGENILSVLESLKKGIRTPFRVLICYDSDDDDTLSFADLAVGDEVEVEGLAQPDGSVLALKIEVEGNEVGEDSGH